VSSLDWSDKAHARAQAFLITTGKDLWDEAERVARRSNADTVSAAYVDAAAMALRMRRSGTGLADVCLVMGPLLIGIPVGPILTAIDGSWSYPGWVAYASGIVAALGLILVTAGTVLKVMRAR
jgi:hypothetical protein